MNARITLIGIEQMLNLDEKSITDSWSLESESFDSDVLLASIIMTGGRFEPLYADPEYFWNMSALWFKKHKRTFEKWFTVFDQEYNPVWDRDGYEVIHEDTLDQGTNDTITKNQTVVDNDGTYSKKGTTTEIMDDDTSNSETKTTSGTTNNLVSGFNNDNYVPHDESIENSTEITTGSGTDDRTTTTNFSENGSSTDDTTTNFDSNIDNDTTNDRDFDHTLHSWGNWGISQTVQKLIEQELVIQGWDIYQHMADIFCDELLIKVY